MGLPVPPLPSGFSTVGGEKVPIKSMTRDGVLTLGQMEDTAAAEVLMLVEGCGITEEEAIAWRKSVTAPVAEQLLEDIAVLSGIRKQRGDKDDGGNA
jgi:hypothetical protein